jgi:hypothetical protein
VRVKIVAQFEHDQLTPSGLSIRHHRTFWISGARICRQSEKRIPVSSIQAVQWKPPGALVNGYIEFTVPGGNETRSRMGSATRTPVETRALQAAGIRHVKPARGATYPRHLDELQGVPAAVVVAWICHKDASLTMKLWVLPVQQLGAW